MTRRLDISLIISTIIHALIAFILFFFTVSHHPPLPKFIEVSLLELPSTPLTEEINIESPKKEKIYKKTRIKRIRVEIGKQKPQLETSKREVLASRVQPGLENKEQINKRIDTAPQLPQDGGLKYEGRSSGDIPFVPPAPKQGLIKEGSQEGNKTNISDIEPQKDSEIGKGEKIENHDPYLYITGPASSRKAIYKPNFCIPKWLEEKGQSLIGRFRFWVLPNGEVDRVIIEQTFGDARVDNLAVSTLSRWRFYKLPPDETRIDWGIVTIKIRLE